MTTNPKPKGPTQTERVQARLAVSSTEQLLDGLIGMHNTTTFSLLERSQAEGSAQTIAEAFGDEQTGGVTLYGQQLPMLDAFRDTRLDSTVLGGAYKKYQAGRKALALAVEHLSGLDAKVQQDITKRTNAIIHKQKGGSTLVRNFQRHLRVGDIDLFGLGETRNTIQFTTGGTLINLVTHLPPQRFDVSDKLDLIGNDWSEIEAQKLLQAEITQHVAALNNHLPTISMASGVSIDPDSGVNLHRVLKVQAQLWHGAGTVSPRQWQVIQVGDGKLNRKKEEVLTFLPMTTSEYSFEGAAQGVLVITVEVGYRLRVKRNEIDDVISGLGMLMGSDLPLYNAVEAGQTLEQHYVSIGLTSAAAPATGLPVAPPAPVAPALAADPEPAASGDADGGDADEADPEAGSPDSPEADALLNHEVREGLVEDAGEPDPQEAGQSAEAPDTSPAQDPADGEIILF